MRRSELLTIARAVRLLNDHPRFGPRDRRLDFDSYSVASELTTVLHRHGHEANDLLNEGRNPHDNP